MFYLGFIDIIDYMSTYFNLNEMGMGRLKICFLNEDTDQLRSILHFLQLT